MWQIRCLDEVDRRTTIRQVLIGMHAHDDCEHQAEQEQADGGERLVRGALGQRFDDGIRLLGGRYGAQGTFSVGTLTGPTLGLGTAPSPLLGVGGGFGIGPGVGAQGLGAIVVGVVLLVVASTTWTHEGAFHVTRVSGRGDHPRLLGVRVIAVQIVGRGIGCGHGLLGVTSQTRFGLTGVGQGDGLVEIVDIRLVAATGKNAGLLGAWVKGVTRRPLDCLAHVNTSQFVGGPGHHVPVPNAQSDSCTSSSRTSGTCTVEHCATVPR